jgi:hypothetical protein
MARKQIYIEGRQEALLKPMAQARGVSEAELIRLAIDQQMDGVLSRSMPTDRDAWEQARHFMLALRALGPLEGQARSWKREDLYEGRLGRGF